MSAFLVLYIFRFIDDNRLTSWNWVFSDTDVARISFFLICGILIAYLLSRTSLPERRPVLFLLLSMFTVSTVFWIEPEVIVDSSRYFTQAKHLEIYGVHYFLREWGNSINPWTDLPLVPFLYGMIFKFVGENRIYIQIFTAFLFFLTGVLTFLIGKTLWDSETGFFGGMLLLGVPYLLTQVPLMLVDIPTMFFLALSIFTLIMALERGRQYIVFTALAIFFAVFSKYSALLMLSVLGIILLVYLKGPVESRKIILKRGIVVFCIAGILIMVPVLLKFDIFSAQVRFLHEYQMPGLRRWGESFISSFFYQIHPFITLGAILSIFTALKKRDLKFVIVFWLVLLIIMLQIRRARYILVMFPMLALMASYGFKSVKDVESRRFIIYSIVMTSLVVAIFAYLPFLQGMSLANLKHAGRFLNSIKGSNIKVLAMPADHTIVNPAVAVPLLDLYTGKTIHYHYDIAGTHPFEKIEKSPLRFTWEYKNPDYYSNVSDRQGKEETIVVLADRSDSILPEKIGKEIKGYEKIKVFQSSTGFFRYSPIVIIYRLKDAGP
jgi:hypothetical protein